MVLVAQETTTLRSGLWSDPAIWSRGVPGEGAMVTVARGHVVEYDVHPEPKLVLGEINIPGALRFSRRVNTHLWTRDNIMVPAGGVLDQGTPEDFIPRDILCEVCFTLTMAQVTAYKGGLGFEATDKGLWVMPGGRWDVHGAPILRPWTRLTEDALAGVDDLFVEHDVSDWYVGGSLVVATTVVPEPREAIQNEVRTIAGLAKLANGGTRITLSSPLNFAHQGSGDFRAEVGLLTRNVRFTTELVGPGIPSEVELQREVRPRKFAHTMYMEGGQGQNQYTEYKYMGHYGKLGRYPTHHHRARELSRGQMVQGNAYWYSGFRAVNLHVSWGVTVEDNVAYSCQSTPFFVEEEREFGPNRDHVFVHNLGVETRPKHFDDRSNPGVAGDFSRVGNFWPGEETVNEAFLGNVGVGHGNQYGTGSGAFSFPEIGRPDSGGTIPFTFVANQGHSDVAHGITAWQNPAPSRDIVGCLFWRNGQAPIQSGAYNNRLKIHRCRFLRNGLGGPFGTSIAMFHQDCEIDAVEGFGLDIKGYVSAQTPGGPLWFARNTVRGLPVGLRQVHDTCNRPVEPNIQQRPVLAGQCSATYVVLMHNTWIDVARRYDFGWQANPNAFWKVFELDGTAYVLTRKDLTNPALRGVITSRLINQRTMYQPGPDALLTPMESLSDIQFTGLLNERPLDQQNRGEPPDFLFTTAPDLPPEIDLEVTWQGQVATMTARVSDDHRVSRVEFLVDWTAVKVEENPSPNGQPTMVSATVDLSQHPRRYAYLYARAFDGAAQVAGYAQRAYSNVIEVGPEILREGGEPPPPPPVNRPPVVAIVGSATVTLPSRLHLTGTATDDGLPRGELDLLWGAVGPAPVDFTRLDRPETDVIFQVPGAYTIRLIADDGELHTTANHQVEVRPAAPGNQPPVVDPGPDQTIFLPALALLEGTVTDDGLPSGQLTMAWRVEEGPGPVAFGDPNRARTAASFAVPGRYLLSLTAGDGELATSKEMVVMVGVQFFNRTDEEAAQTLESVTRAVAQRLREP